MYRLLTLVNTWGSYVVILATSDLISSYGASDEKTSCSSVVVAAFLPIVSSTYSVD